ncbi:LppU/SCO3897 family protein [Dactylosporangium sp. CS-047395]|uniref:LppU/SCO3897 family protein n=1 Tax=Dactylosporangium sp. CS-047395 TaxID=3239936 RepID=UPI003D8B5642
MTTPAQPDQPLQQPEPPQSPQAPATGPAVPGTAPAPKGKGRQVTILVGLVVLVGVLLGAAWFFNRDAAVNANVGDCLHNPGDDKLTIVKCDSADAQYSVLGKASGKTQIESTNGFTTVCDQWPDTTDTFWQGKQGEKGDVLCLKAVAK